jgi:hypothetical protein
MGMSLIGGAVYVAEGAAAGALECSAEEVFVYRSVNAAGDVQYVGITNDLERRAAEHLAGKQIEIELVATTASRAEARAAEQALIEIHGFQAEGGTLMNQMNSISPASATYASEVSRGYEILQSVGY